MGLRVWSLVGIRGTFLGGPKNKDSSILGSIYLGPSLLGNYRICPAENAQFPCAVITLNPKLHTLSPKP